MGDLGYTVRFDIAFSVAISVTVQSESSLELPRRSFEPIFVAAHSREVRLRFPCWSLCSFSSFWWCSRGIFLPLLLLRGVGQRWSGTGVEQDVWDSEVWVFLAYGHRNGMCKGSINICVSSGTQR